ncbi:MAG: DUF4126 domain-containing protein [Steroidobacteraceae bacterium]|nr:DUF4126 domain-containing protein [Steroidobacteraceae bacterium]
MSAIDVAGSIALGIALAAAAGFRVFLPLLITSVAAYTGHLQLSESFAWLGSVPAMATLAVATIAEILAYYIPVVDNLLDTLTTPAALVAGTLLSAAVMTDLPPIVKWSAAVIAGGGAAGITQSVTAMLRAKSTAFTGGIGNPVVATAETGSALVVSGLAILAPLVAIAAVVLLFWFGARTLRRVLNRPRTRPDTD